MRFNHLALPVTAERAARDFYVRYFGFDPGSARRYDDGTLILQNADGFRLALHPVHVRPVLPTFFHFGFEFADAEQVRALATRLRENGVQIAEQYDEPGYVAVKCLDPNGYRLEAYWEAQ